MEHKDRPTADERGGPTALPSSGRLGRRSLLKGAAAVTGGTALAAYTPPRLQRLGMATALAVSGPTAPVQGSPGFWMDKGKSQAGLWDVGGDLDWKAWAQKLGLMPATPANPYVKTDPFTSVFAGHPAVDGFTMQQIIEGVDGGTEVERAARHAARALVASYLNASLYGSGYSYTQTQLKSMWERAVTANTPAAFETLKGQLESTYN